MKQKVQITEPINFETIELEFDSNHIYFADKINKFLKDNIQNENVTVTGIVYPPDGVDIRMGIMIRYGTNPLEKYKVTIEKMENK